MGRRPGEALTQPNPTLPPPATLASGRTRARKRKATGTLQGQLEEIGKRGRSHWDNNGTNQVITGLTHERAPRTRDVQQVSRSGPARVVAIPGRNAGVLKVGVSVAPSASTTTPCH